MNLLKKTLALGALALATAQMSYAVPAYPKPFKVKQADGSYVTIQLRGDEYSHLAFSQDGYPLVFNDATGNFEYAKLSNSLLLPSGITAREAGMRSAADKAAKCAATVPSSPRTIGPVSAAAGGIAATLSTLCRIRFTTNSRDKASGSASGCSRFCA